MPQKPGNPSLSFLIMAVFGFLTGVVILAASLNEQLALKVGSGTAVAAVVLAISFIGALQGFARGGLAAAVWTGWLCGLLCGMLGPLLLLFLALRAIPGVGR